MVPELQHVSNMEEPVLSYPLLHNYEKWVQVALMTILINSSTYSVAFSGDGTRIISGSSDNSMRVWDASTGAELKTLLH